MKTYEFVPMKVSILTGTPKTDHREIITEYTSQGFRYVGWIPTRQNGYGQIREMDLVFEKDR